MRANTIRIREAVNPEKHLEDVIAFHAAQARNGKLALRSRTWAFETIHLLQELQQLRKRRLDASVAVEGIVR